MENSSEYKKYPIYIGIIVVILCIWLASGCSRDGRRELGGEMNVITFSGYGEVSAVPDLANVSFTIRKEAKTIKEAQVGVKEVEVKVLESLRLNNVSDKDIKTINVSFNPKYEYKYGICNQFNCPGKNVIVGYEAYESVNLKIRNTDDTGKIIEELGALGVTELSGPNFTIDKEDELKAEARREAIGDAKTKAKVLAKELGIRLGKITSFSESGNYPMPMYKSMDMMSQSVSVLESLPAEIPKGENTISSEVTITYQIR